jgi:hypothetical protein
MAMSSMRRRIASSFGNTIVKLDAPEVASIAVTSSRC